MPEPTSNSLVGGGLLARNTVFNFLGPVARGAWWNLSTSELISVAIFALGVTLYVSLGRRAGASAEPAAA